MLGHREGINNDKSQPKEIFLEMVKSDEYPATFTDGPIFINQCSGGRGNLVLAKQKDDNFSFKNEPSIDH